VPDLVSLSAQELRPQIQRSFHHPFLGNFMVSFDGEIELFLVKTLGDYT
jgi:hypothetical protein